MRRCRRRRTTGTPRGEGRSSILAGGRAGYSAKTANTQGPRLLSNVSIREAIERKNGEAARNAGISKQRVLQEYQEVAFNDLRDCFEQDGASLRLKPLKDWPVAIGRSLAAVKVKRHIEGQGEDACMVEVVEFRLWDKLNALEKLGKHLELFKDRVEVTGKGGGPITFIEFANAANGSDSAGGRQPTPALESS